MTVSRLGKLKEKIKSKRNKLEKKFSVKEMGIFGSYIRDEQSRDSDIDILVDFQKPISLFKFLDLEEYLSELLNGKIDLVSRKALKPQIGQRILQEVQPLW